MKRRIRNAFVLTVVLLACGCATPAARIKRYPDMFAAFPADVQEQVSRGEIHLGYTRDMVFIALGEPHRTYTRQTSEGQVEIWAYTTAGYRHTTVPVHSAYHYRDANGRLRRGYDVSWVDVGWRDESERLRVEIKNGEVSAIEALKP